MPRGDNQGLRYLGLATDAELAWAAGLFEGEGTFCRTVGRKSEHRRYLSLTVTSTDPDVLERLRAILGIGTVRGPYAGTGAPERKPIYHWGSAGFAAVQLAKDERFVSWLGSRRRSRLAELLEEFADQPRLKTKRGERCVRGHRWTEHGATYKGGRMYCKECRREKRAERRRAWT